MQLFRSARWLMPALLFFALPTFCHAQLFKSAALHLLPAVAQPQAQTGTPPSTTPPASEAMHKRRVPMTGKNEPTAVDAPQAPTDPQANEAMRKRHAPVTVKNLTTTVPPPPPTGTVHIPTKPVHGEDNPTALPTRQGAAPRTGPCPPHVVCADSGAQTRAGTQAHPDLPVNQQSAPGRFTANDQLPHRPLPNSAPWSREDKKQFYASSDQASARIQASEIQGRALLAGVRSNNTDQVRAVLLRNGLTEQQLDGARFVLHDETGGHGLPGRVKVRLSPDCCPLTLIITITF